MLTGIASKRPNCECAGQYEHIHTVRSQSEVKTGEKVRHFVVVVCCYFPAKIYLADIYQKPLGGTVLMRTHNI